MPILNNPASGSLSREENWVPTRSGDREIRPNGILIEYYKIDPELDWRAKFINYLNIQTSRQMSTPLKNFVADVRNEADQLETP